MILKKCSHRVKHPSRTRKNNIGNSLWLSLISDAQQGHDRQNEINSFSQTFLAKTQRSANKRKLWSDNHFSRPPPSPPQAQTADRSQKGSSEEKSWTRFAWLESAWPWGCGLRKGAGYRLLFIWFIVQGNATCITIENCLSVPNILLFRLAFVLEMLRFIL